MLKLIIVRHGETIENVNGICQGQTHGTLSARGKQQNKLLAKKLNKVKIHKIYTSPLKRALETAREIHNYHRIELEQTDQLSEWYLGKLQGEKFPEFFDLTKLDDDMENAVLVKKRLLTLMKRIATEHKNETVMLVSHGLTIKVLISILKNIRIDKVQEIELMKNSDYKYFIVDNNF